MTLRVRRRKPVAERYAEAVVRMLERDLKEPPLRGYGLRTLPVPEFRVMSAQVAPYVLMDPFDAGPDIEITITIKGRRVHARPYN